MAMLHEDKASLSCQQVGGNLPVQAAFAPASGYKVRLNWPEADILLFASSDL
jgi:hypothetical protein